MARFCNFFGGPIFGVENENRKIWFFLTGLRRAVKTYKVITFDLDRALQSKSTTVGDYRRGPEPDRQKARCRAGTVRGRGTSSATEQVSADENLRRFIPSKSPLPSRSSLPWSPLSHNFFFLWRHSFSSMSLVQTYIWGASYHGGRHRALAYWLVLYMYKK